MANKIDVEQAIERFEKAGFDFAICHGRSHHEGYVVLTSGHHDPKGQLVAGNYHHRQGPWINPILEQIADELDGYLEWENGEAFILYPA